MIHSFTFFDYFRFGKFHGSFSKIPIVAKVNGMHYIYRMSQFQTVDGRMKWIAIA